MDNIIDKKLLLVTIMEIFGDVHKDKISKKNRTQCGKDDENNFCKEHKNKIDKEIKKIYESHENSKNMDNIRNHRNKMSPVTQNILQLLLKEKSLNQSNIAKMINVTSQAVSETIKKLEKRELIIKTQGELNNEKIISLTEKGVEHAENLEQKLIQKANGLFENFSENELETLYDLIEKIKINKNKYNDQNFNNDNI